MTETDISRVPPTVNLELYAGDGIALRFTILDSNGNPFPLGGDVVSQIKAKRSDAEPLLEWTVDTSEIASGFVTISLTGDETASLITNGKRFHGVWDLQFTPTGAEPMTFIQGKVDCSADVTR